MPGDEQVLSGGNSTAVVRRGDAVHRAAGPWTPAVLPTAARQLADVHAATRTFLQAHGPEGVWQQPTHHPAEVVCLNDVAPHNMVFDKTGDLTGWIDVDTASPGPRVWDLAHLAYRLVPLTGADDSGAGAPDLQRYRRRLAVLCQAYAAAGDEVAVTPAEVLAVLADRLVALADDADARHAAGAEHLAGHADFYRREGAWLAAHAEALAVPAVAQVVVVTGPIAAGKSTTAAALATAAASRGLTAVVLDVDDVAAAVTAPGAGASGLWPAAHHAHGALVAGWLRSPVDLVVAVGPISSPAEQAALLDALPPGTAPHWALLDAPVATTSARAGADPTRGLSREPAFHAERHARFRRLRPGIPAAQSFDTATTDPDAIAGKILAELALGR